MEKNKQQDKIRGSLIGGAVGDALGYPVEFMSLTAIRNKYGERGITNFELDARGLAVVSDDTQMTLFTANGLMFGVTRSNNYGAVADLPCYVMEAYKEWYQTQTRVEDYNAFHTCWIRDIKELNVCRAPGNTCLSALRDVYNVNNNSKGCGGIMRVAPVALYLSSENERAARHSNATYFPKESIDKYAGECAAITHKHPLGYMSAALFVDVLYQLLNTEERVTFDMVCMYVESALSTLMNLYTTKPEATALGELWYISKRAIELAKKDMEDTEAIRELGEGWVAEETWAIALYCVLKHLDSFEDAIVAAVNHDGDSDSTGSVCGNLMGVIVGYNGIPEKYKTNIELKNVMLAIADDMVHGCNISEYHPAETMDDKQWALRYIYVGNMDEFLQSEKWNGVYTPERISMLNRSEVFVFGSNLAGTHGGGAARIAYERFGAVWGQGIGMQGQSYAIPTMQGGVDTIKSYVDEFINFARQHRELTFLVTRIGCGIAGFRDDEIAPLFKDALYDKNIILPFEFVSFLESTLGDY